MSCSMDTENAKSKLNNNREERDRELEYRRYLRSKITSASLNSNSGWRDVGGPQVVSAAVHVWQKTEELGVGSRMKI